MKQDIVDSLPSKAKPEEFKVKLHRWSFMRTLNGKDVTVDIVCKNLE